MDLSIAENIRRLRKERSLTQEQLAEALGVTVGAAYKWENGRSVPEINMLMQMADLFEVSLDALVGFEVRSGGCKALEERILSLQKEKKFDDASIEAEKALTRYPNNFSIVYRAGEMYYLKGFETGDSGALNRSIELLERAILLLSQNTDTDISEFSIRAQIAQCLLALNKNDKGLEVLKKYNACGVNNPLIAFTYAADENCDPKEAEPYLVKGFGDVVVSLLRIMEAYANYYTRIGDNEASLCTMLCLIQFLESIKTDEGTVSYVDKLRAPCYSGCAPLCEVLGRKDEVEPYLRKAYTIAKAFDAAPVYSISGIRFCVGDSKNATVYDDIGKSAMEAVERQIGQKDSSGYLKEIWRQIVENDSI